MKNCVMNFLELVNKYPDKIEIEVDYIVYHYDNFKFYLKIVDITDDIGLWFYLQEVVLNDIFKIKTK